MIEDKMEELTKNQTEPGSLLGFILSLGCSVNCWCAVSRT